MSMWDNNYEIQVFREYLRIPSVHPNIEYEPCVEFLHRQANSLDLEVKNYYPCGPTKPVVIMTWIGTEPDLPKIVLNSHMDVVAVFEDNWIHPPFDAYMDTEGRIYARGAQDMKSQSTQYLGAIRAIKRDGIRLRRTILLMFVPDEETTGEGMREFVKSQDFRDLNVGFSLDEGNAVPGEEFALYYGERTIWHVQFQVSGTPGHGSLLLKNTAGEKLGILINKFMDYRKGEVEKLENNPKLKIGDVTTVNLTILRGGVQDNVVPPVLTAFFDIRLAVDVNHSEFEAMLRKWCDEAGGGIKIIFDLKEDFVEPTALDGNIFWTAFKSAIDELGLKVIPEIDPGGTDSRFIRHVGIPAINFSPINNTPYLLHDDNEFLQADIYLKGMEIMKKIIINVGNA